MNPNFSRSHNRLSSEYYTSLGLLLRPKSPNIYHFSSDSRINIYQTVITPANRITRPDVPRPSLTASSCTEMFTDYFTASSENSGPNDDAREKRICGAFLWLPFTIVGPDRSFAFAVNVTSLAQSRPRRPLKRCRGYYCYGRAVRNERFTLNDKIT